MPAPKPPAQKSRGPKSRAAKPADASSPFDPKDGGLPARAAAVTLLNAALARRSGLDEAMNEHAFKKLAPQDRGFARALAMAGLRNLGRIDRMLDARLHKPPPEPVRDLLRLGVAQLLALDTPDFAAVATTVSLAQRAEPTRPFKGLINAVLRGLVREPVATPPEANVPDWLYQRWLGFYGEAAAQAVAAAVPIEPPTDLTLKGEADAALVTALEAERLPGGGLRTARRGDLATWPGFDDGSWWVQDAAAAVPARLLAVRPGELVADLCAAPGGKTLQLAVTGATVVAVDRSGQRLTRVMENLKRMGLAAEIVTADAERWDDARAFDAILLDAPCSATGTFRRNPEVLWGSRPADIAKLADVQHRLLDAAAGRVKPGGRLVYCVCSLEREEGESQAIAFLRRHPEFSTLAAQPGEGGAPEAAITAEGWLRILPSQWADRGGLDGFFIARFIRQA